MSQSRLQEQLTRQMGFIARSCSSFDAGFFDEAIRIATTIRVLVHQTSHSNSLLNLLGVRETLKLLSSIEQPDPKAFFFDGVSGFNFGGPEPNLNISCAKAVDVPTWWSEIAVINGSQINTRKSIVLAASNKDGGAHVDPMLTPEYRELIEGLYIFEKDESNVKSVETFSNHQFIALRVFAHELLNSPELLNIAGISAPTLDTSDKKGFYIRRLTAVPITES